MPSCFYLPSPHPLKPSLCATTSSNPDLRTWHTPITSTLRVRPTLCWVHPFTSSTQTTPLWPKSHKMEAPTTLCLLYLFNHYLYPKTPQTCLADKVSYNLILKDVFLNLVCWVYGVGVSFEVRVVVRLSCVTSYGKVTHCGWWWFQLHCGLCAY